MHIDASQFKDRHGRTLMLRGVNLGGSSKVPAWPAGATHLREGFFDHRSVSFVGRPFPLAEADEHFARLRRWGFAFIRFLATWEAIEHAGPGEYDEAYLDYIRAVAIKAGDHGMRLLIDPHQDVWSRFSGGDGAPGWTLEAVGLDMAHFQETGAAIVHAMHGDPFPRMIWPTNGIKLAAATMFTLFFGGDDFAPLTKIDGEPAQEYLQRHYIAAIRKLAEWLAGVEAVVGYDTMNEPLAGYIGWQDLRTLESPVAFGISPTPFQSMLLGEGIPQEVTRWELRLAWRRPVERRLLNAGRQRAWRQGCGCVWRANGVWDLDAAGKPHLLRPCHFSQIDGRAVDFAADYYGPFAQRFAAAICEVDPSAIIFVEAEAMQWPPACLAAPEQKIAYAPHWYDGYALFQKAYNPFIAVDVRSYKPVWLPWNIRKSFASQLAHLKAGAERLGGAPVVIGEFGIPFDMHGKAAYRSGDFRLHEAALDRTFQALEANLLHGTLWNYTPDNTNERGDLWNVEDLSIFSRDQQADPTDPDSGGRALRAAVRPYPIATAGEPLHLRFDMKRRTFEYTFRHDPEVTEPTEIYVPAVQYPGCCRVEISDGRYELRAGEQVLLYWHSAERAEHTIWLAPDR